MGTPWKELSRKTVHQNPWFKVRKSRVVRPDGKKGEYFVVETRGPAAFVLARDPKGRYLFVQMFRFTTQSWSIEVPAGSSEGQPLLKTARRELFEETGYEARRWKLVGKFQSCNGIASARGFVFLATGLSRKKPQLDKGEGITRLMFLSPREIRRKVAGGRIVDGETLAALFLAGAL